jgi:hypothetical protein
MTSRPTRAVVALVALIAALVYFHEPPWTEAVTSGLRPWEDKPPGTMYRWTDGRASFFVPASATAMTLPLRAVFPGPAGQPVTVDVRADDRWLATIELRDPDAWVRTRLPLGRRPSRRHFRRIDLRVSRVIVPPVLGVMTGRVEFEW